MILTRELPHTFAALAAGLATEDRALAVARETIWLSRQHRAVVDAEVGPQLEGWGDRRTESETRKLACALDPHGATARLRAAETDRHVSLRPAPDAMARLTALLPVAQGVAAYTALTRHADSVRATGDARGRGQVMADTLVERLTGQSAAPEVPVEVHLVMTDHAMLGEAFRVTTGETPEGDGDPRAASDAADLYCESRPEQEPAVLLGYGPLPAPYARRLIAEPGEHVPRWVRRLYARPESGQLVAMDSSRRAFPAGQARLLTIRDQYCRTPWCGAPIRHLDHVQTWANGGRTSLSNGQGLCEACNHAKQALGWASVLGDNDEIVTITPTGHAYRSRPPTLPGSRPRDGSAPQVARPSALGRVTASGRPRAPSRAPAGGSRR